MPGFALSPAGAAFQPTTPQQFPNFIQFRLNGVDIGGPDVTVVNFEGPFVLERGTGDDANKLTISLDTGG